MSEAEDTTKRVVDSVFERLESAANDPLGVPDVSQDGLDPHIRWSGAHSRQMS